VGLGWLMDSVRSMGEQLVCKAGGRDVIVFVKDRSVAAEVAEG